jgi:predicted nucleic acid-binding protein
LKLILDASMALGWLIQRTSTGEAQLAQQAFDEVRASGALVPALWFPEIANTLLVFERAKRLTVYNSTAFLSDLARLQIEQDDAPSTLAQTRWMDLGRIYRLTAYDATYLELALRTGRTLATFDTRLADAVRKAGGRVFGDAA